MIIRLLGVCALTLALGALTQAADARPRAVADTRVDLTVFVDRDGAGPQPASLAGRLRCLTTKRVRACDPARVTQTLGLRPAGRPRACAARRYGPEVMLVRGQVGARRITMLVGRRNSCEHRRYRAILRLLAGERH
jgi:hypothetical protein